MKKLTKKSRRDFLKTAAAVAVAAPYISRVSWAKGSPMQKLQHAAIAVSGKGRSDIAEICGHEKVSLFAAADVDATPLKAVKNEYGGDVKLFSDWREMLTKLGDEIDTVSVSTPDHIHGIAAMSAMNMGKHVYCQKPLVQTVLECRQMLECAGKNQVVVQMGTQGASSFYDRISAQLISDEAVGKIEEAWVFSHKTWGDSDPRPKSSDPVPKELDWDLWLGVAQDRPFIGDKYYHTKNWRRRQDFGTGTLGDMGCHIFSPLYKGLKLTLPTALRSETSIPNEHNWAFNEKIEYWFPKTPHSKGDIKVTWISGDRLPPGELLAQIPPEVKLQQGCLLKGTRGLLVVRHGSGPVLLPREDFADYRFPKFEALNHYHAFVDAVLDGNRDRLTAPIEHASPMCEFIVLGNVATRFTWQTLEYDAKKMKFPKIKNANKYLRRNYRRGWKVLGA